jgi:hypothetical protein
MIGGLLDFSQKPLLAEPLHVKPYLLCLGILSNSTWANQHQIPPKVEINKPTK